MKRTHLVSCLLALLMASASMAQQATDTNKTEGLTKLELAQIIASAGEMIGGASNTKDKAFPDFADVTKDMESSEGLFTLWSYPASAKDKDSEKLLAQIPSGFLGEKFMLSTSFSGGGFFTGFPLDERVVTWERLDKQLLLMEPETRFVIDRSNEVSDVVNRTYPDRIRAAVPIVTVSPSGDPVIDLGGLLKSDFAGIAWMSFFNGASMGGVGINSTLSKWTKKKTFELNVEIGVELAVRRMSPSGSYDKKMVHYSFWKLPHSGYSPRVADDRVGYFITTNQDWAKPTDSRDLYNRYVDRWQLEKRDPSLALCEPKQPIIYYIEKTVPVRFRRAVRDGILEWNKAFEKVGFLNAVEVRQQTDDNEWKDLDPEDMRYSFFRWIVTGAGFAMGPHRSNPFTGQIYDADIVFDDSMVRFYERKAADQLTTSAMEMKAADPVVHQFLDDFPQFKRPGRDWTSFSFGDQSDVQVREALREQMQTHGRHLCDYSEGMKHQMAVADTVLCGAPKEVIERFLYEVVKEVVMHEVGHTLGLRHNFKASSVYTLDEIQQRRQKGEATVGSVMDYNPALLFADNATSGDFVTPTIGPYDYWAIEYGYRPFDSSYKSPETTEPTDTGDTTGDEEKSDEKEKAAAEVAQAASISMDNIPEEVLEQIPPELRKQVMEAIASGAALPEASTPTPGEKPDKPKAPGFASPPTGEEKMLMEIASRCNEPELAYATDEDTTFISPDPRANRFDAGADPIDWAQSRIDLVDKRMKDILNWSVKDQESWYHLRRAFVSLLSEKAFVMDYVGRYIGGQYFNRNHRGDAGSQPPFELVDAKTQRAALTFIADHLYSDAFFQFSPELLNHLAPSRWWNEGESISFSMDFPLHDMIGMIQWWNIFDRLFPETLRRIHDAELKTDAADRLTVAEYIQTLQGACWKDATNVKRVNQGQWTDAAPFVSDVRRSLQREYLGMVEPLVRTRPGTLLSPDLHAMMMQALRNLQGQIDTVLSSGKLDFASQAHLVSCKSRIDRMLSPELREF